MSSVINKNVFITDRDKFIAGSGSMRKKYLNKNISKFLENIMRERKSIIEQNNHGIELIDLENENLSYIILPIIRNGDAIGLVIVLSDKNDISLSDEKNATVVSQFLGKHIEE